MGLGLARSDAAAEALAAVGAETHRGSIEDLESLQAGAEKADAVIHTAFNHDFSPFAENCADDRRVIEAMGAALEGTSKPMLVTSVLAFLAAGRLSNETDHHAPNSLRASEAAATSVAARGVRISSVRLPPSTHGAGDGRKSIRAAIDQHRARDRRVGLYRRRLKSLACRASTGCRASLSACGRTRRRERTVSRRRR